MLELPKSVLRREFLLFKRNNYNHIYNQRNCCCDHRDLRFTDSLKYSIGNVGHSIQKYRKGSKHQKLSGHTICSSKQQ